jgi:hypothetical protein
LSGDSGLLTVIPGAAVSIDLTAPASATAGTPFDLVVTLYDVYGNVATGYLGTVGFASTDPYPASLPANYTFLVADAGTHTFTNGATLYTVGTGSQNITATDTVISALTDTESISMQPGAVVILDLVLSSATAGSGVPISATVILYDAYGNIATNFTGVVSFLADDLNPGVVLPPDYTFTTGLGGDNGQHTYSDGLTLITAGTRTVEANTTVNKVLIFDTENIGIIAPPAPLLPILPLFEQLRYKLPWLENFTPYQITPFDLMSSADMVGPTFFYHPLTPSDMSAFEQFIVEEGAYNFIDGQIGISGHDGLMPIFEEIKKKKKPLA